MQLANRLNDIAESITLAVSAKANALKKAGVDVVSFGAGEPDFDTPEFIKDAAIKALKGGMTKYCPTPGTPEARKAIADKLGRENGLPYKPEEVIVSVGGKHALYTALMAVLNPGDEVIIPAPYWVSYPEMVKLTGAKPVYVAGDAKNNFKITAQQLAAAITPKTRLVIINSPSNPGGHTYSPDELAALAKVILPHKDVMVCSDEIYERLLFGGQKTALWAAADFGAWKDRTITCNCLSKTFAMTGWRIGYTAGPKALVDAMNKLQSQMTSNITSFCMPAIVEAYTNPQSEVEISKMREAFEARGMHIWQRLNAIPGVTCVKPTGAFYVFPNIAAHLNKPLGAKAGGGTVAKEAVAFATAVLEEAHVALVPGNDFGFPDHVRLSFATSMGNIDKGIDRLEKFLTG